MSITTGVVKQLALECGFELAGITPAVSSDDFARFEAWRREGNGAEMSYLTDRRGDLRNDPRHLLPSALSMVCVGRLYNVDAPHATDEAHGWISRYAWGEDYHKILRSQLELLVAKVRQQHGEDFEWRICVDTAPLLERSYARTAGLGWIGKNTCLINQAAGSWFFLGELLLSIPLAPDTPPPDRCGTCTRCIDACPTAALVPDGAGDWTLDARRCISYLTIENRGPITPDLAAASSNHVFGCDICQDVCPWNRRAPFTNDASFAPAHLGPALDDLASISEHEFRTIFRHSPILRARHRGFLRNVAHALGNSSAPQSRPLLEKLTAHPDTLVAEAASQALERIICSSGCPSSPVSD